MMRLSQVHHGVSLAVLLSIVGGCGSGFYPAEGVVTLDGEPLPDATVVFQAPDKPLATARTDSSGRYSVETGSIMGMKPGKYRVAVSAYLKAEEGLEEDAPELAVPEKYVQPDSSGFQVVISHGTNLGVNFNLTSEKVTKQ